jgi:HEAT repeat protein
MTRKLTELLLQLGNTQTRLSRQALVHLSDLNAQELAQFQNAWATYDTERRVAILDALLELAETHVEYDYRSIFRWTLNDSDARVRARAIAGLWEDEHPRLIPIFQRLLANDPAMEVREAAAVALGRFVYWGETGTVESPLLEDAVQALWDSFHTETEVLEVRCRALEGLAASGRPGVIRLIENALYSADLEMRASALFAMGRNADPRWIPYLLPYLDEEEPVLRLEAVRALGELEARQAVRPLIRLIARETDNEIRMAALTALGQIGGPEARRALEAATDWEDEAIVATAEAALEELLGNEGNTFDLINQVLGLDEEEMAYDEEEFGDLLEEELRALWEENDDAEARRRRHG